MYVWLAGVYLSVNGTVIANNSDISIMVIGEGDDGALLCFTDLHQCCSSNSDLSEEVGQWYFPNQSAVENSGDMYMNRGHGVVRLHRKKNVTMPTGVFHCEIPDASGTSQNIYIGVYYRRVSRFSAAAAWAAGAVVGVLLLITAVFVLALLAMKRYVTHSIGSCNAIPVHVLVQVKNPEQKVLSCDWSFRIPRKQ